MLLERRVMMVSSSSVLAVAMVTNVVQMVVRVEGALVGGRADAAGAALQGSSLVVMGRRVEVVGGRSHL